jgi:hypothetical protein
VSEDPPTNGKRAALALDAVSLYARSSPWEGSSESTFFFDFERDALPGGDQDRLAALLCGLMHYAERRSLSFPGALAAARQEYARQRTAYLPGQSVRRAGPRWRAPAPGEAPLTGEVIAARPGRPAQYHVDFITGREWLPETALAPAPPFPAITTSYGTLSSAFIACYCMRRPRRKQASGMAPGRARDDRIREEQQHLQGDNAMTSQWPPEAIRALGATTDLPTPDRPSGYAGGGADGAHRGEPGAGRNKPVSSPSPSPSPKPAQNASRRRRTTAHGVVAALELPAPLPATPARPLPLVTPDRLPSDASMLYEIGQVDVSGRVSSRDIVAALSWQPRDRLELLLSAGAIVLRTSAGGLLQVPRRPCIMIPASARHRRAIKPGDRVLIAAAPDYGTVIIYPMSVLDDMIVRYHLAHPAEEQPDHE